MALKRVTFEGWKNCIEVVSGNFRLVVATEIGPRILGGFLGDSENIFWLNPKTLGQSGDKKKWIIYGGHRLWHAPEDKPRTYTVENFKVNALEKGKGLVLSTPADDLAGFAKTMEIQPTKANSFKVIHKIKNCNRWPVDVAAWSLSVMAPGGRGILPMPQGDPKSLLPNTYLSFWPYNNMADGRIQLGSQYTIMNQIPKLSGKSKIGYNCEDGWLAYQNKGVTFIKKFDHFVDAEYPDNGCSAECFTNGKMMEIESLSPMYTLDYQEEITHTEYWTALRLETEIRDEKTAVEVFG